MAMMVVSELAGIARDRGPIALAIGFLDGVHLGHQRVIREAIGRARAAGGQAWVLTFEPHPLRVVRPERAPPLITPLPEKLRRLEELGLDGCAVLPFTREFARHSAAEFVGRLAREVPQLHTLVCGQNFHFGHDAVGVPSALRELARPHGFEAVVVEPVQVGGQPVSSTRIRHAVTAGRMGEAAELLGRAFAVRGVVEEGRGIGRRLGFPTANLGTGGELMPPHGVYAVRVRRVLAAGELPHPVLAGAGYFGPRPTFETAGRPALEVHLLEHDGDWYGREIEVEFVEFIRPDQTFDSPAALSAQIARDIERIRAALSAVRA